MNENIIEKHDNMHYFDAILDLNLLLMIQMNIRIEKY